MFSIKKKNFRFCLRSKWASYKGYRAGTEDVILKLIPHSEIDNPDYAWLNAFAGEGSSSNYQIYLS
jgi:hypothetical protein